jgi:hypothetical protein
MAKKSKKQTRNTPAARPAPESVSISASVASGSVSKTSESDFNPDYSMTIKDLKRIGTLAASFIVVLIVLSFFLR